MTQTDTAPLSRQSSRRLRHRALATRTALLDALEKAVTDTPWREIGPLPVARQCGYAAATFYQYFADINDAFDALLERLAEEDREPSEHMRLIADLLQWERREVHGA